VGVTKGYYSHSSWELVQKRRVYNSAIERIRVIKFLIINLKLLY